MRVWVLGWVLLLCVACQTQTTLNNAIPTTPIADLPVSLYSQQNTLVLPTPLPADIISKADAEYILLSNIYERTTVSVVNIEKTTAPSQLNPKGDTSRGSGFVYSTDGYIITNAHVMKDAQTLRVTFNDGHIVEAQSVGYDSYSDIGVLRVNTDSERLIPLELANSDAVRVGQRAITIGNPFGLNSSMSVGIISGVGRTLRSAELIDDEALRGFQNPSIIQTDTPINPGNSGGPLLNSEGLVMGVTTAIRTDSGVFVGVGFAVPSNTVLRVVPELIAKGRVDYPWMGISVTPEENGFGVTGLAEELDLPVQSGVLVRGITLGSPADKAGLRGGNQIRTVRGETVCLGGDIIVAINNTYVNSMDELVSFILANMRVGETVILRVVRDNKSFDVPMTLEARPSNSGEVKDCAW
jgi:S1-C subfamily serine protease